MRRIKTFSVARGLLCGTVALVALAVTACGSSGSSAGGGGGGSQKLTYSADYTPPPFDLATAANKWASLVKQGTKGQITIKPYFGGALYPSGDAAARALASGQLDLGDFNGANLVGLVPDFSLLDVPYIGKSLTADVQLTNPKGKLFQLLNGEAQKKGIVLLPVPETVSGEEAILMKGKIRSLSQLSGKKIRSPGDPQDNAILSGLGGSPINLAPSDLATALKTGTVDGAIASTAFANGVAKGLVQTDILMGFSGSGYIVAANANKWNALSAKERNLMVSTLRQAAQAETRALAPAEKAADKAFTSQGSGYSIYHLTGADNAKLKGIYAKLCEAQKSKTSPAVFAAWSAQVKQLGATPSCS